MLLASRNFDGRGGTNALASQISLRFSLYDGADAGASGVTETVLFSTNAPQTGQVFTGFG